jgi:hypothetical protein
LEIPKRGDQRKGARPKPTLIVGQFQSAQEGAQKSRLEATTTRALKKKDSAKISKEIGPLIRKYAQVKIWLAENQSWRVFKFSENTACRTVAANFSLNFTDGG